MMIEEVRRLIEVITQPVLLVSAAGEILVANTAATRLDAALREGRRLQDVAADGEAIERQLREWLRQGGPVPGRLDLLRGGERVRHRLGVGRVALADDPVLLVHFGHGDQQDRLAQLTDRLRAVHREARYRRAAENEREAALDTERVTRRRIERLQALTSAMAAALSAEDALAAIREHAPAVVGAERVLIEVGTDDPAPRGLDIGAAEVVGASNATGSADAPPQPLLDAIERHETLRFDTPERLVARYPHLAADADASFIGIVVPLMGGSQDDPIGALGFVFDKGRHLTSQDETPCRLIAAQSAQALERARLYDREHRFAETLQRALLPRALPSTQDIDCAVRYLPAAEERVVGGDWYDVIPLGGAQVGLAVGDVAGHGPAAATAMGQMRNALRALATTKLGPAATLEAFNRFVCGQLPEEMATAVYLVVDTARGTLTYANAGHLPPLLVGPGEDSAFLEAGLGPPIGVATDHGYRDEQVTIRSQSHLVVYTDGLVERRGQSIDEGLDQLRQASQGQAGPDALCEALLSSMVAGVALEDDAAVLVASVTKEAGDPRADRDDPTEAADAVAAPDPSAAEDDWRRPPHGAPNGRADMAARQRHRRIARRRPSPRAPGTDPLAR